MRLVQLVGLAAFALLSLKLIALIAAGAFDGLTISAARAQDAQTGNTQQQAAPDRSAEAERSNANDPKPVREIADASPTAGPSGSSREGILARLGDRRDAISKREQDLELREELLQAAEKRLKAKLAELKKREKRGGGEDGANPKKKGVRDLVTIYETMKPKDAARIFNALSIDILCQISTAMSPRKMSAILAEMDVKAAERLTVQLAARAGLGSNGGSRRRLQKIGG